MSRDYTKQAGEAVGYSSQTRDKMIKLGVEAYDLCTSISDRLEEEKKKKVIIETQPKKINPYDDPDWASNDPRGW